MSGVGGRIAGGGRRKEGNWKVQLDLGWCKLGEVMEGKVRGSVCAEVIGKTCEDHFKQSSEDRD